MPAIPNAHAPGPLSPAVLLRAEGAALLAVAVVGYAALDAAGGWWLFAACFLLPDVAMLGYLAGPAAGARAYNLAHTESLPLLVLAAAWMLGEPAWMAGALIWLAHVGFDRVLGYGLKYPTAFRDTHLGRLGGSDAAPTRPLSASRWRRTGWPPRPRCQELETGIFGVSSGCPAPCIPAPRKSR